MNRKELEPAPSEIVTSTKNSMSFVEMMPKKKDVLNSLHKRKTSPGVAAPIIITDAREHSRISKFAVGPYCGQSTLQHFPLSQGNSHEC